MSQPNHLASQPDSPRSRLRTVARWIVVLVIFWLIGRGLVSNWEELARADLHFDIGILLLSLALLAPGKVFLWMGRLHFYVREAWRRPPYPRFRSGNHM